MNEHDRSLRDTSHAINQAQKDVGLARDVTEEVVTKRGTGQTAWTGRFIGRRFITGAQQAGSADSLDNSRPDASATATNRRRKLT